MKILIVCSTSFYDKVKSVRLELEKNGHEIVFPNGYAEDFVDEDINMSDEEYKNFFRAMFFESREKVSRVDAILVLNFDKVKNGKVYKNYIGASTFLEMYEAFVNDKKIYMYNGFPDNMLLDEIKGFNPVILNGELNKVI